MTLWTAISDAIERATGRPFDAEGARGVGGGSISRSFLAEDHGTRYFVKVNAPDLAEMFEAEAAGLALLAAPGVIRVPAPVCHGRHPDGAFLVLEHVEFGVGDAAGERQLGEGLAAIHRETRTVFGWDRDNTIGSTPQPNTPEDDWVRFFARHRLGHQLDLVAAGGGHARLVDMGRSLVERLPALFEDYRPAASLLHGDLWGGNAAFDAGGRPVIFDPAVYFGDRESDLAMTELFGGFSPEFYRAYREAWPLDAGYETRRDLYQLYHVLNHLNLFGGGYAGSARRLTERLLAVCG
ncbi:MAG TPA: fructosamine kinase family protein [Gammaproteobacteria bacterium]|nr:fructosamine kinase family protein [Gammaproteobacteria bacterium]